MRLHPLTKSVILLSGAMALTGCEKLDGTVSGGGTMQSLGGNGKAVFTVNAKRCDDKPVSGRVNFRDATAIDWQENGGVAFNANVVGAGLCGANPGDATGDPEVDGPLVCDQACGPGLFQVEFDYDSTNPLAPGAGKGIACMTDLGEGANAYTNMHGVVNLIRIDAGPFMGYTNGGVVSGNIQTKDCPSTKNDDSDENA